MANKKYSDLEWSFNKNSKDFLSILIDTYQENPYYLNNLDKLMRYLRENECKNVQEKLMFIADFWYFQSILSELEIAEMLIINGKKVEILPDNYDGMISPPDIHVTDQIIDAYIEVTRITSDQTIEIISKKLNEIIRNKKIPFAIDVDLNNEISVPAFNNERDIKRQKIFQGLKEFNDLYESLKIKKQSVEVSTSIGLFKLRESKIGRGYSGNMIWGSGIPYKKVINKIRKDIIFKAKKREKWNSAHLNKYYIIALDFEDMTHDPMYLESAIFGSMTYIDVDAKFLIKNAKKRGWDDYLSKMNMVQGYHFLDPNRWGVFFTSEVVKNVSGVIGKFRGRKTEFYPNPFSFEDINNPKLVDFLNNDPVKV